MDADAMRSTPLHNDPHDERAPVTKWLAAVFRRAQPSDWEKLATQTTDLLLTMSEKYEFVAAALEVANEEATALRARIAVLEAAALERMPSLDDLVDPPHTMGDVLFAATRDNRPVGSR